jgi:ATP-dependent RNA helicase DeaD
MGWEHLDAAIATPPPDEFEAPFVTELLAKLAPEQIAAAYLRQQLAARPVPEELSDAPIAPLSEKPRRENRFEEAGPREPRQPDMVGGVWFTLSLGRKHRADPKAPADDLQGRGPANATWARSRSRTPRPASKFR